MREEKKRYVLITPAPTRFFDLYFRALYTYIYSALSFVSILLIKYNALENTHLQILVIMVEKNRRYSIARAFKLLISFFFCVI
jgi:hypothetical protein